MIDLRSVSNRLQKHLDIKDNLRIILSGRFGVGKTYFLNEFFKENSPFYNAIVISPVDYVVSSNEDIFELIKADIIKYIFLQKLADLNILPKDTKIQKASSFLENNPFLLQSFLAKFLVKLNPTTAIPVALIETVHKMCVNFRAQLAKKKENTSLTEDLLSYACDGEEKVGSIYEHNYITKCINVLLEEARSNSKKNVLILDDLDRIDPDHIFRILNILSAHNNNFQSENKFGFDHIILVCDLDNIKKIFYNRYGKDVDFDGYIDKFYSTHILDYTNNDAVITFVKSLEIDEFKETGFKDFLILMLQFFVQENLISVRKLMKFNYKSDFDSFPLYQQQGIKADTSYLSRQISFFKDTRNLNVQSSDLTILHFFKLMTLIFGDFETFYDALNVLKMKDEKLSFFEHKSLISFLALQYHIVSKDGDALFFKSYFNQSGNSKYLTNLGFPEFRFLGSDFKINLIWSSDNPFDGSASYFLNSRAIDINSVSQYNDILISASDIVKAISEIALLSTEKKFLQMAHIGSKKLEKLF